MKEVYDLTFARPANATPVVEDPWDVSGPVPAASRAVRIIMAVLVASWAMLAGLAIAQPAPPPTDAPNGRRVVTIKLSPEGELLAEDYLFLLEQLNLLTADYADYFSEMRTPEGQKCLASLNEVNRILRDTAAYAGYIQLSDYFQDWQDRLTEHEEMLSSVGDGSKEEWLEELSNLDEHIDDIKADVAEFAAEALELREEIKRSRDDDGDLSDELEEALQDLRASEVELKRLQRQRMKQAEEYQDNHENHRIGRLTHGLAREVSVLQEMFQESVVENLEDNHELAALIEARVKQVVAARLGDMRQPYYILRSSELDADGEPVEVPELIEIDLTTMPDVPELPEILVPWINVGETDIYMPGLQGNTSLMREMADSVIVSSNTLPVIVVNPVGQLEISGWKSDKVTVTCEFEIVANSSRKAEKIIEQLDLRIYERKQAVFVEIVAPELTDPRVSIGHTRVRINAPRLNPLVVKSSAGRARIGGFENGAKISTNSCDLTIEHTSGTVDVVSNMGSVNLSDVTGPIGLRSSNQPLKLIRCNGDMDIKNTYALISLIDCGGTAKISNSGPTKVIGFAGMVDINNSNGQLELERIDGDVIAVNKLQPLLISEVSGSATLENTRGTIRAEDMSGLLSISNSFASIVVRNAKGPLHLVNEKGSIDLAVASAQLGPSTIICEKGTVNLKLGSRPNILLTVESMGGAINSSRPMEITTDGNTSSARMELGQANQALAVTGTYTTITIK